jgi:peptidoglycan/xylan/chitin deacetylase (PgdA/CDA1 family)
MKLRNTAVLETIFTMMGNFAPGSSPLRKVWDGIEVTPFKDNADAAICISADFELSWGWRARGQQILEYRGRSARRNFPLILAMLDEYSTPITFATVGHLFLESCERSSSGLAHANMPRPLNDGTWTGDWYSDDPCSNVREDPLWYGPDLIQQIMECKIRHEIGTHSFSHINFMARYSSSEVVRRELEACAEAMQPYGLRPKSLVFPRNRAEYSYLQLLADAGIVAVRHRDRDGGIRLSHPERTPAGVYKIYESMNLRIARHYDYLEKAKLFIQKAMERHAVYSLWFHPSDPTAVFETQFRGILRYIDAERKKGRLWVARMEDLAAYCEAREQLKVRTERVDNMLAVYLLSSLDVCRYGEPEITLLIPAPCEPRFAWLELVNGERKPLQVSSVPGNGLSKLMATVPTTAKALQFVF